MKKLKVVEAAKGFKYLYGKELAFTKKVISKCEFFFGQNCYEEVVTPFLTDYDYIVGNTDRPVSLAKSEIVFNFLTANNERFALRYENTLPICKFYIDNFTPTKSTPPKKFFYISQQFRNESHTVLHSRLRQFHQVGWEIIGGMKKSYILDAIETGMRLLDSFGLKNVVKISEVNILNEVFTTLNLTREAKKNLLWLFDEKDKKAFDLFLKNNHFTRHQELLLLKLFQSPVDDTKYVRELIELLQQNNNHHTQIRIQKIEKIQKRLKKKTNLNVQIDFSLVRSNKFYSGVIFQYYIGDNNHECGGGGEYDRIINSLGGASTIACGAAFGLERVIHEYKKESKIY